MIGISGCGKTAAPAAATGVAISGTVATSGTGASARLASEDSNARLGLGGPDGSTFATAVSSLTAVCFTADDSGTSAVAADGTFAVNVADAKDKQVSCSFKDATGAVVGDMVFSDDSKKSLSGSALTQDSVSLASDAALGAVTLNLDSGEVVVPQSVLGTALGDSSVVSGTPFDFSGTWTIGAVPTADLTQTDTDGHFSNTLCTQGQGECNGPPGGQPIFLKRVDGKDAHNNNAYGMMVWQDAASYAACGSKLGRTYASLLADTGIDFSASGVNEGAYSFSSSVTASVNGTPTAATLTEGWKLSTAKAKWAQNDCGPVDVGTEHGWQCTDSAGKHQISLGGGCKLDSTHHAVQPAGSDWSNIHTCTSVGPDSDGFYVNTCTGNIAAGNAAVTCTNKYKQDTGFNWSTVASLVAANSNCSSIATDSSSNKLKLLQLQCYANAYYEQRPSGGCLKKIRTNYTATDPANFLDASSNDPESLVFANMFDYDPDGQSGGMFQREISYRGVRVQNGGNDTYVNCKVKEVGALKMKRISDTKLKATYVSTSTLAEAAGVKPACDAQFSNGSVSKFVFYLNK